jgi:ribosome biogenesis GTPase A
MPPKRGGGGGGKPTKNKKPQKSDSDDDWVPTDVFGNPMPVVDTSGWNELKTFEQAKRQGSLKSKGDSKRVQRQEQQRKDDKTKNETHKSQHEAVSNGRVPRSQIHNNDQDDGPHVNNTYYNHDGAQMVSQRERSRSHSHPRFGTPQQGQAGPRAPQQPKEKDAKPLKPPQVYKPTTITLTSFENRDRSFGDSAAGSKPITVRTIFAKMTPEEKDEQRRLTLLQLPTYSSVNGAFLPENITTLTPGYIPGRIQPKSKHDQRFLMPLSPLYHQFHLSFPHRPNIPNPRALTPQQYRDIEENTFHKWLEAIYTQYSPTQLNHFEHNLYVWKQLWLCCESSDIILIIIDARNPLFHFNSHLYSYIVKDLKKPFVLVLNKIDLLPIHITLGFKSYLERTFPGVHVVLFSSYPSALHSFVLALQHQSHGGSDASSATPTSNDAITMETILKHGIDVTANDIATHQRTVVNRMKMANIIDTVGVDELLQLCLHLTRGHAYHSPAEIYEKTMKSGPNQNKTGDDNDITQINDDDIHSRRILSQREELKWQVKNKKQQFQQEILQEHLKKFVMHADRHVKESSADLADDMEELTLNGIKSSPSSHAIVQSSYFRDTDAVEYGSDYDEDDEDDDSDDEKSNKSRKSHRAANDDMIGLKNGPRIEVTKNNGKRTSQEEPNVLSSHPTNSRIDRIKPPQIGNKFVKPLKSTHPYSDNDEDDESDGEIPTKPTPAQTDEDDDEDDEDDDEDDEDDDIDYDHLEQYIPELSMTDSEKEAIELSHMAQESPTLSASRQSSPSLSGHGGKIKPVFDLQRVLQHIYSKEENSREAHNKTKSSLRTFQQQQREAGLNGGDSDDDDDKRIQKEHKMHKKQQPLTKAQIKEEERRHAEFVRHNRIKIGFVGHPNVGKSSVVNAISRKKTVSVSRQPGHTKYNQTIKINELITLIDCPGLIFPALDSNKISSTLFGLYPIPQVSLPIVVIYYLAQMIDIVSILDLNSFHPLRYEEQDNDLGPQVDDGRGVNSGAANKQDIKTMDDLLNMKIPNQGKNLNKINNADQNTQNTQNNQNQSDSDANIGFGWTANMICEAFATKRGFMTGKGSPDPQRAAQQILYLISDGKIQLYMLPPDMQ